MEEMELRVADVAEMLAVSAKTVTRWVHTRGLPARRLVGRWRFSRAEVERWAQRVSRESRRPRTIDGEVAS